MKKTLKYIGLVLSFCFSVFWLYHVVDTSHTLILTIQSANKYDPEYAMYIALMESAKELFLNLLSYLINFACFIALGIYAYFSTKRQKSNKGDE